MMNLKDKNQEADMADEQPADRAGEQPVNPEAESDKPVQHAELSLIQSVPPPKPDSKNAARDIAVKGGVLFIIGAGIAALVKKTVYPSILKLFPKNPPFRVPDEVGFFIGGAVGAAVVLDMKRRASVQKMTRRDLFAVLGGAVGAGLSGILVPRPPVKTEEKPEEQAEKEPEHSEQIPGEHPEDDQTDAGDADQNALGPTRLDGFQNVPQQETPPQHPALTEQDLTDGRNP